MQKSRRHTHNTANIGHDRQKTSTAMETSRCLLHELGLSHCRNKTIAVRYCVVSSATSQAASVAKDRPIRRQGTWRKQNTESINETAVTKLRTWYSHGHARADLALFKIRKGRVENITLKTALNAADCATCNQDPSTYDSFASAQGQIQNPDRLRLHDSAIAYRVTEANKQIRRCYPSHTTLMTRNTCLDILRKSAGRCAYCNIPLQLICGAGVKEQFSLDRINNALPYGVDNCVASCLFCNLASNTHCKRAYVRFTKELGLVCRRKIWRGRCVHSDGLIRCKQCRNAKPLELASDDELSRITRYCQAKYSRLNDQDIRNVLEQQRYKCALTGVRLMFVPELLSIRRASTINHKESMRHPQYPSVDRINNLLPHTPENCIITANSINLGRQSLSVAEFQKWFTWRKSVKFL